MIKVLITDKTTQNFEGDFHGNGRDEYGGHTWRFEVHFKVEENRDAFYSKMAAANIPCVRMGNHAVVFQQKVDDALVSAIENAGVEITDRRTSTRQPKTEIKMYRLRPHQR